MAENPPVEAPPVESVERWQFLRDVIVFQLKLGLDAARDLVLVPVSIAAALLDVVAGGAPVGRNFYRVFGFGRRTDRWINLFDSYGEPGAAPERADVTVDALVGQLEGLLVEQYDRGGLTASTKAAIDRALDGIERRPRR